MGDNEIDLIIGNEREWRKHILYTQAEQGRELKELRRDLNNFKIKMFGLIISLIAGVEVVAKLIAKGML